MNIQLFKKITKTAVLFSLLITGCTAPEDPQNSEDPSPCLSDAMSEMISIVEVTEMPVYSNILLPGQITVNSDRVYRLYPAASGMISDVRVRLGDRVQKGQVLATVQSPDVAEFNRDLRSAIAKKQLSERNLSLAQSLFDSGVYSERDLIEARSTFERAEAEVDRMREQQKVLGLSDGESVYTIRAPESGFIVQRNINPGLSLRADDDHMFEIADLRDVWVVAHVSESDIRKVQQHNKAIVTTLAYPDKQFTGEIVRTSSTIDPDRRTMEAIIELPNPDFMLKPGMFANIQITAERAHSRPVLDSDALIFDNNEYFVVVYEDDCNMEVRQVYISTRNQSKVFIESGIEAGESVVTNRQLLIYNKLTASR
jgi:membrane fusion protein, heavy metal efflux system